MKGGDKCKTSGEHGFQVWLTNRVKGVENEKEDFLVVVKFCGGAGSAGFLCAGSGTNADGTNADGTNADDTNTDDTNTDDTNTDDTNAGTRERDGDG